MRPSSSIPTASSSSCPKLHAYKSGELARCNIKIPNAGSRKDTANSERPLPHLVIADPSFDTDVGEHVVGERLNGLLDAAYLESPREMMLEYDRSEVRTVKRNGGEKFEVEVWLKPVVIDSITPITKVSPAEIAQKVEEAIPHLVWCLFSNRTIESEGGAPPSSLSLSLSLAADKVSNYGIIGIRPLEGTRIEAAWNREIFTKIQTYREAMLQTFKNLPGFRAGLLTGLKHSRVPSWYLGIISVALLKLGPLLARLDKDMSDGHGNEAGDRTLEFFKQAWEKVSTSLVETNIFPALILEYKNTVDQNDTTCTNEDTGGRPLSDEWHAMNSFLEAVETAVETFPRLDSVEHIDTSIHSATCTSPRILPPTTLTSLFGVTIAAHRALAADPSILKHTLKEANIIAVPFYAITTSLSAATLYSRAQSLKNALSTVPSAFKSLLNFDLKLAASTVGAAGAIQLGFGAVSAVFLLFSGYQTWNSAWELQRVLVASKVKHIVHRLFDIAGELHFCSHLIRYSTRHDGDNSQTQVVEFVNNDTKHMWYEHVNLKYELNEKKKRKMGVKKLNQLYAAANVVDYVNFRRREFEVDLEGLRKSVERLELERIPVYPVNNVKESEESGSSEDAPGEANPDIPC